MSIQIVYVLTFDESNLYFEQLMLSVYSARKHNPEAKIVVVTDTESAGRIEGARKKLFNYVDCIQPIELPQELSAMQRSRVLKTSLRNLVEGDFLFLDTDTVICRPLDGLLSLKGDICAVADGHRSFFENNFLNHKPDCFAQIGIKIEEDFTYFNSGVLWVCDNKRTRMFYRDWHEEWKRISQNGIYYDQISLHLTDLKYGNLIQEIGGEWHCQPYGNFINYLAQAYIIHYYPTRSDSSLVIYSLSDNQLLASLRREQYDEERMEQLTAQPLQNFIDNYMILVGKRMRINREMIRFSSRHLRIFRWISNLTSLLDHVI